VAGWELPSPPGTADADRRFETVWTLDPGVVRAATRVAIGLVHESDPALSETLAASLPEVAGPASPDLQRATSLFARILDYSQDAAGPPDLAS
jgi:DICT domain-containing protein